MRLSSKRCVWHLGLVALLLTANGAGPGGAMQTVTAGDILGSLPWRGVGPAHMSGRITDVAVEPGRSSVIYCASATGGVWKSVNNGTTWEPIFDDQGTSSIGDIAISPSDPEVVWVGTGEANASSYSSWGDGVYRSVDGGDTWVHLGLEDTHHIGRVVVHPSDPGTAYVAALGHLWGGNPERGLFRTVDGGASWDRVLFVNDDVGVVDVAMDPRDPQVLYAATYGRRADSFDDFDSMGIRVIEGGGLFKTTDGGDSWRQLENGLPDDRIGRIGLAIADSRPDRVYAIVEREPHVKVLDASELEQVSAALRSNGTPDAAVLGRLRGVVEAGVPENEIPGLVVAGLSRTDQLRLRALLGQGELDSNGGVFRSDDAGGTWERMSNIGGRDSYYAQIRVDPTDPDHVYVLLVRTWESLDGGRSFRQKNWAVSSFLSSNFIHGDFHAMWIDPENPSHLIVGSDGGLFSSYDAGATWANNPMPLGQFVAVAADAREPYYLYGGLQDNGVWGGPSATRHVAGITHADWFKVISADGAYVAVDPTNPHTLYVEPQYGRIVRVDMRTGAKYSIAPSSGRGEPRLRFNFVTPFILSPHDSETLYIGAQRVFRSTNRGDTWQPISPDLTRGRPEPLTLEGATITTLAESPLAPGLLWVGTDDGNVQVTSDGGANWTEVGRHIPNLPGAGSHEKGMWVSRVEPSHFDADTAYVSFDGHRDDDFAAYLYVTTDRGQSWTSLSSGLPAGASVNVVREDPENPGLLYVGNERGVYASIDSGRSWQELGADLPTVPVDDLLVHLSEGDLIAATHGRSLYILDVTPLQQLTQENRGKALHLFEPERATLFHTDWTRNRGASGARRFRAPNQYSELVDLRDRSGQAPPGASLYYLLGTDFPGAAEITVLDDTGEIVRRLDGPGHAGLHRILWDLRGSPRGLPPEWQRVGSNDSAFLESQGSSSRPGSLVPAGRYLVRLTVGGQTVERELWVEEDRAATAIGW